MLNAFFFAFGCFGLFMLGVASAVMIDEYALRPVRVRKERIARRISTIK